MKTTDTWLCGNALQREIPGWHRPIPAAAGRLHAALATRAGAGPQTPPSAPAGRGDGAGLGWGLAVLLALAGAVPLAGAASQPPTILAPPRGGTVNAEDDFGLDVLAGGTPPFGYQWSFISAAGVATPLGTDLVQTLTNLLGAHSGTYRVVVTNAAGTNRAETKITVTDPAIAAHPAGGVWDAGSTRLGVAVRGTPPFTYQWYRNGVKFQEPVTTSAKFHELAVTNAPESATYHVAVSNAFGTRTSSQASITVHELAILKQPAGQTAEAGADVVFAVEAYGWQPLTYQWHLEDPSGVPHPIPGATSHVLTLASVTSADRGNYRVAVRNGAGAEVMSAPATLKVNHDPRILRQPAGGGFRWNDTHALEVAVAGVRPFTYRWYFNRTQIQATHTSESSNRIDLSPLAGPDSGTYDVTVSNAAGTVKSLAVTLTVLDPVITTVPENATVGTGDSHTFSVVAAGTEPLSYQWFRDGRALAGQTNRDLSLADVTPAHSGSYSVAVINALGSASNAQAVLTVHDLAILRQPQSVWQESGGSAEFAVEAVGSQPITYQWHFRNALGDTPLAGQTGPTLRLDNVASANMGAYTVRVTSGFNSLTSSPAALIVADPVIRAQPRSAEVVSGTNVVFSVLAGGTPPLAYQWHFTGADAVRRPIGDATADTLELTNVTSAHNGGYSVQVSNPAGTIMSATAQLTARDLVILTHPQSTDAAAGETVTFRVVVDGTPPFTYQWRVNGRSLGPPETTTQSVHGLTLPAVTQTNRGTYDVQVSHATATNRSDAAVLTVGDPVIRRQPRGGVCAENERFPFEVTAAGTEPIVYQWYYNGSALAGEVRPTLLASAAGTYAVRVRNAAGTLTSSNATLMVTTNTPRLLHTGNARVDQNSMIIPLLLEGNGTENTVAFSMAYDTAVLDTPDFIGADPRFITEVRLSDPGRVGVTVQMPPQQVFERPLPPARQLLGWLTLETVTGDPFRGGLAFTNDPVAIAATSDCGDMLSLHTRVYPSLVPTACGLCTDPQSGLALDQFQLRNPGTETLTHFLVGVSSPAGVDPTNRAVLWYAQQTGIADTDSDGVGDTDAAYVQIDGLGPGAGTLVTFEFYIPHPLEAPQPDYFFVLDTSLDWTPPSTGTPVAISEVHLPPRYGRFAFDFLTQTGFNYCVRYADQLEDLLNPAAVKTAKPALPGTGGWVRWVDYGLPKTEPPPAAPGMRFYQVIQIP
ncbi:MAG: immunoglobulin domain-containing protein [Verrucomicrobia bacterium]|nr:immunoglobulin domain-containing protein [Verrucomicrobiota bacterium]